MNCHNGGKYLKESINSILNQSYHNWELIFWNNSSFDNSKKIFLEFKDKRLKYFEDDKLKKLYDVRNLAIKKAKGKYIAFLDTDDYWKKEKLKKQIQFLEKKKASFIFSNFYVLKKRKKKIIF